MIYYNENGSSKIVPLSKNLIITGVQDSNEISDLIRMFAKVKGILFKYLEIKTSVNSIMLTMCSVSDALKIIAVFTDYEYKS